MPRLKIVIDSETLEALERRALSERRPADSQVEVLLRQSLGLPFPVPSQEGEEKTTLATRDRL